MRRALTCFLAMVSLSMGVGAFVCLSAFNQSDIKSSVRRVMEKVAWDLPPNAGPMIGIEISRTRARGTRLDAEWLREQVRQAMATEVAVSTQGRVDLKIGRHSLDWYAWAASSSWVKLQSEPSGIVGDRTAGRLFTAKDDATGAPVCIIGRKLAEGFESDGSPVGRSIKVNGLPFRIVGVVNGPRSSDVLVISFAGARSLFRIRSVGAVDFLVRSDEKHLQADMDRAWSAIPHALGRDYKVTIGSAWLDTEGDRRRLAYTRIFLGLLSMLPLSVGLLGMVSMLLANLNSRVREIGLHRALGATRLRQALLVLSEAGLTGLLASLIGIPVGTAILRVLSRTWGSELRIAPTWIALAVLSSVVTAILAGLIPARAAMRISPAESLRAE